MLSNIIDWSDIEKSENWGSILLGNGFSLGVSKKFSYRSLFDEINKYDGLIDGSIKRIFTHEYVDTRNFEEVLRIIYHALLVDEALYESKEREDLNFIYNKTKNLLIEAINNSHVSFQEMQGKNISACLSKYNNIFTTNYDLIPYWAASENNFRKFKDFFWGDKLCFDINDSECWGGSSNIYYLHGALHLTVDDMGRVYKTKLSSANNKDLPAIINDNIKEKKFPLFISEGLYYLKYNKILSNPYLNFCYNSLLSIEENIVIYGHDLSQEYDYHISCAIIKSRAKKVAISVFNKQNDSEKSLFIARMKKIFEDSDKELLFFNSESHPCSLQDKKPVNPKVKDLLEKIRKNK